VPNGNPSGAVITLAAESAPDRAAITARLLETVRDRTGYPIETLGLELDIEADLGIDSIKRVEILGKLRDEFPSLKEPSDSTDLMDSLARARTLGAIVDRMAALAPQAARSVLTQNGLSPSSWGGTGADRRDERPEDLFRLAQISFDVQEGLGMPA